MSRIKHIHFPPPVADDMVRVILAGRKTRNRKMFEPYYDFFPRWWFKPAKPVRHQPLGRCKRPQAYGRRMAAQRQTCPVRGRKLVNTYLRDGVWKCRRCWEEESC